MWEGISCGVAGTVTQIDVSGQGLRGTIPLEFYFLSALSVLELSYNNLYGNLFSDIAGLSNLQTQDLRNIYLSGTLPKQLGQLHGWLF